ncbi:hypothetical protein ACV33M_31770, partial [Pseudomonas aeruginosa]
MNLDNRIKFRHLACFLEVARQRSFAKAADAVAASGAGMVPNGQVGDEVACDEIAPWRCSASLSLKGEGNGWSIVERNDSPILRRAAPRQPFSLPGQRAGEASNRPGGRPEPRQGGAPT